MAEIQGKSSIHALSGRHYTDPHALDHVGSDRLFPSQPGMTGFSISGG